MKEENVENQNKTQVQLFGHINNNLILFINIYFLH